MTCTRTSRRRRSRSAAAAAALSCLPRQALLYGLALATGAVHAALPDEIQVYDDSSNPRGVFGLELHVNATPSGRGVADYPGEITPVHGLRTTFEPSYGLSDQVELGAYLPFDHLADGSERFAGPRARLKLIGKKSSPADNFFYGLNFELSDVKQAFELTQYQLEVRAIFGWRSPDWLWVVNPVADIPLKAGERAGGPSLAPAFKVARTVANGVAAGIEYYTDLGQFSQLEPWSAQSHTLFLALDVDAGPAPFNIAVGRGLTAPADHWTIKAIVELPI